MVLTKEQFENHVFFSQNLSRILLPKITLAKDKAKAQALRFYLSEKELFSNLTEAELKFLDITVKGE